MSVYRTLLEENEELGGVLDDNNSLDIAEIDKVIEDHDANEDEQVEAQAAEFGPSDDVDSIMDETAIAIAESEMNFNMIMQAMGIHEVSEAAAGREVLYENAITDWFKKAKDWVVNFFKKVWSVLKRYAANIASAFHTNKGLADKKSTEITKGYDLYKSRKGDDHVKIWNFDDNLMNKYLSEAFWNLQKSGVKNLDKNTYASDIDVDQERKNFRRDLIGGDPGDDFRSALKKKLYGEEKVEKLIEPTKVIAVLKSGESVKKAKKAMDNAKKEYKSAISKLNEEEKKLTRTANKTQNDDKKSNEEKDTANAAMAKATKLTQIIKNELQDLQVVRAVVLTAARTQLVQCRALAHAYIGAYNRDKHKGFTKNESTEYGFLGGIDFV